MLRPGSMISSAPAGRCSRAAPTRASRYSPTDGRAVVVRVARSEAAAEVIDRELAQRRDRRHRLRERLDVEDLRADVNVQAPQAQPWTALDPLDQLRGGGRREPELRALVPGQHVRVRLRLDAGDHAYEHVLVCRRPAPSPRAGRRRRSCRRRRGRCHARPPSRSPRRSWRCRAAPSSAGRPRPRARSRSRRRRRRRGRGPPRPSRAGPRCTGTPWTRTRRARAASARRARGRTPARARAAPARRRPAPACRTPPPASSARHPPTRSIPSPSTSLPGGNRDSSASTAETVHRLPRSGEPSTVAPHGAIAEHARIPAAGTRSTRSTR